MHGETSRAALRRVVVLLISTSLLLGLMPRRALAQPVSLASDDPVALFERGNELFDQGNFAEAYAFHEKSHRLRPSYDAASNAGLCAYKLGRFAEAARLLRFGLDHIPASVAEDERRAAQEKMTRLFEDATTHIGVFTVRLAPRGAELVIDGNSAGIAPIEGEVFLEPGEHRLLGRLDGHANLELPLTVRAGESRALDMTLQAGKQDDARGSSAPAKPLVPLVVTGSIFGAGALGAGIGLFVVSVDKASEREELAATLDGTNQCGSGSPYPNECAEVADLRSDENTFRAVGITFMVVGSAAGVATLLYGVWPRGHHENDNPKVTAILPFVDDTAFGLTAAGTF